MTEVLELTRPQVTEQDMALAAQIVDGLPRDPYETYRQPVLPDRKLHVATLAQIHALGPVADPRETDRLQERLTDIALDPTIAAVDLSGRCAQRHIPLSLDNMLTIVEEQEERRQIVAEELGENTIDMARILFQDGKPRTSMWQTTADGRVVAYLGDGYNDVDVNKRTPDPRRMLRSYAQAVAIDTAVRERTGRPLVTAHEGLNLGLELAMRHRDPVTGREYNGTGNVVWIGDRTNDPYGPIFDAVDGVANPVGVKIGPTATPEKIMAIHDRVNPEDKPGKVIFMIRVNAQRAALDGIVRALPRGQIYMHDPHDLTVTNDDGDKLRSAVRIADDAKQLAEKLDKHGLPLHGLGSEVEMNRALSESVFTLDERPRDKSIVDPGLHPDHYRYVLHEVAPYMPGAKAA